MLSITEAQLVSVCQDIFVAGTETGSTTITFCLMFMCLHPNIQEKIHQELDSIIGQNRYPTYADKEK